MVVDLTLGPVVVDAGKVRRNFVQSLLGSNLPRRVATDYLVMVTLDLVFVLAVGEVVGERRLGPSGVDFLGVLPREVVMDVSLGEVVEVVIGVEYAVIVETEETGVVLLGRYYVVLEDFEEIMGLRVGVVLAVIPSVDAIVRVV